MVLSPRAVNSEDLIKKMGIRKFGLEFMFESDLFSI